jgi:spermidine/putrescine-binding protein
MFKYDVDVTGAALIYSGHDVNATDQAAIDDAKEALLDIKPHLRALLETNLSKPLEGGEPANANAATASASTRLPPARPPEPRWSPAPAGSTRASEP